MCDANDRLLVAGVLERAIRLVAPETGAVLATYGQDRGAITPDDVALGPDGTRYWTNIVTGGVARLAPDGRTGEVVNLGTGVNAVRVSPDGNTLYVSKAILGDALYAVDLAGAQPPRLIAEGVGWPNGMDFGPDGHLYSPLNL